MMHNFQNSHYFWCPVWFERQKSW